jgi:pimeloyl-ACP methyl ester carboxylesterase
LLAPIGISLFIAGCAGVRPFGQIAADESESGIGDAGDGAKSSAATATPTFVHSVGRSFPEQGWWCSDFDDWLSPERADQGYTIVLPGVEGTSLQNINIARGLVDAGHPAAIEVRDWTTGSRALFVYHLVALERNRKQAQAIAAQIVAYQDQYPERPVTLIGHSGGAALAVLVLEALPPERSVSRAILLAAAISPDHDLSVALARTELGIVNFHSWGDVAHLVAGTSVLGTVDRQHSVSAGASGFHTPEHLTAPERDLYATRLVQIPYRLEMLKTFNMGGHLTPTNRKFVAEWVAPYVAERR